MANGSTPGNGSSNPFGNGSGGASGGNVAGNNFITNPQGSRASSSGRRFDNQVSAPQTPRDAVADRSAKDAAPGTLVPLANGVPREGNLGVGSIGNATKPFRVS